MISSFFDKSNISVFLVFKFIPNKTLNQDLQKPIRPKTLAISSVKKHTEKETSIKPEKIKNSTINFNVPGNPEKKIIINIILNPRLGVCCNIPFTSIMDRDSYLLYIQSTKKNINADK